MTKQEIFNKAVRGLAKQGFEQAIDRGTCKYRQAGLKCAAGHLIKDRYYNAAFEGDAAFDDIDDESNDKGAPLALRQSGILKRQLLFVREVQRAHDNGGRPYQMKSKLVEVAQDFNLKLPKALRS